MGSKPFKIGMNKQEALAFHLAYDIQFINNDCPFATEIYITIDRSLNEKTNEKLLEWEPINTSPLASVPMSG